MYYIHVYMYICVCVYICIYTCMCVCVCVCVCIYIYVSSLLPSSISRFLPFNLPSFLDSVLPSFYCVFTRYTLWKFSLCWSYLYMGFPDGSGVKNPLANIGDMDLILRLWRSPGEGKGNLLQCSCLENPIDRRTWKVNSSRGHKVRHDWTTELILKHTYFSSPELQISEG